MVVHFAITRGLHGIQHYRMEGLIILHSLKFRLLVYRSSGYNAIPKVPGKAQIPSCYVNGWGTCSAKREDAQGLILDIAWDMCVVSTELLVANISRLVLSFKGSEP